jgi:hypothetical protein
VLGRTGSCGVEAARGGLVGVKTLWSGGRTDG